MYKSVCERITGAISYNRINRTGNKILEWEEFANLLSFDLKDGLRRRSANNTIINKFEPNYSDHEYVKIGHNRKKVLEFLIGNNSNSSVCANMWGHGGVGKTATIQNVCEHLLLEKKKNFTYIIFLTAKDRYFNVHLNQIVEIDKKERVDSYENLIISINRVLQGKEDANFDEEFIVNHTNGRILIIIDDFETFTKGDRLKIDQFVKLLNPNYHKVIITTRATIRIGNYDISFNEFSEDETTSFLIQILKAKFPKREFSELLVDLKNPSIKKGLKEITQGKALRIWQLANTYAQMGRLFEVLNLYKNSSSDQLNQFFYGRIYDYISDEARDVFDTIGQLNYDDDLTNLISKVKFIANLDDKDFLFQDALKELEQLRVIELLDDTRFRVWDKEILQSMQSTFSKRGDSFRGGVTEKVRKVGRNKNDLDEALLNSAKQNKFLGRSHEEIIRGYRELLNRPKTPQKIKLEAFLDLISYHKVDMSDIHAAISECENFEKFFGNEPAFVKTLSLLYYETPNNKEKSVELILKLLSNIEIRKSLKIQDNLELAGLLIIRQTKVFQERYDKMNIQASKKIISKEDFKKEKNDLSRQKKNLINYYGKFLLKGYKSYNFSDKGQKTQVETGLRSLAQLCIRNKKFNLAKEICAIGMEKGNPHFQRQFSSLKNRIPDYDIDISMVEEKLLRNIHKKFEIGRIYKKMIIGQFIKKTTGKSSSYIYGSSKSKPFIHLLLALGMIEDIDNETIRVLKTRVDEKKLWAGRRLSKEQLVENKVLLDGLTIKGSIELEKELEKEKEFGIRVLKPIEKNDIVEILVEDFTFTGTHAKVTILEHNLIGSLYIGELIFGYVNDIRDVLKKGDKLKAKVLSIEGNGRINLSTKSLMKEDQIVKGKVNTISHSYAEVLIPFQINGLNHTGRIFIGEIANEYIEDIRYYLSIDEECDFIIIGAKGRWLDLSLKKNYSAGANPLAGATSGE